MKKSAAGQLNKAFVAMIQRQFISVEEAYETLGLFFLNSDIIQSWTELLHIKYENFETYLTEQERLDFIADAVSEFAQCRQHLDPTSRLLLGGASPSLPSEVTFWNMQFPNILIQNLKKGGTYGCIWGFPRTGKTSLAVSLMELFISDTQLHILTNIVVKEQMEQIHFCPTLSELVRQMAINRGWIAILDETATFVPRKRALSTENLDFENLGRFVGKLGGRLIMITHDFARDVPPILQSWTTEQFHKINIDSMYAILSKQSGLHMNRMIVNIPDCNLSFITEDITGLHFDISIKKLLAEIQTSKGIDRDEQKDAIINWLKENEVSGKEKKKKEDLAIGRAEKANVRLLELESKGFTKMRAYRQIAEEMGLSPETIRSYMSYLRRENEQDIEESVEITKKDRDEEEEEKDKKS
jgi:hypothetical protein